MFVATEGEVSVDARLVRAGQQVLEPLGGDLHSTLAWHVGERDVTGPEADGLVEPSRRDGVVAIVERVTPVGDELFEPARVDMLNGYVEDVARGRRSHAVGADELAQSGDPGLQRVRRDRTAWLPATAHR